MAQATVPVAVHMWFANGDGWAYHPDLKNNFQWAVGAVAKYLKFCETKEEFIVKSKQGTLVGERLPDMACKDPRAVNRSPFILRFGYLDVHSTNEETIETVRERLGQLDLPKMQGECSTLEISLVPEQPSVTDQPAPALQEDRVRAPQIRAAVSHACQVSSVDPTIRIQELQERQRWLSGQLERTNDLLERKSDDFYKLEARYDRSKNVTRSAKKALLTTFLVGLLYLICWICWPFGDRWLLDLLHLLFASVMTGSALTGLYLTKNTKIFRWFV